MKRRKKPVIIDVEPVEVETRALAVTRSPREARYVPPPFVQASAPSVPLYPAIDPVGRIDVAAYRFAAEYALPWAERIMGVPGLASVLAPWAEVLIAEYVPAVNIFIAAPKPRRRLRH
jgi:hypothetical protein